MGPAKAEEFLAGYLLEQSLSVDNLFVFILVFNYFKTPVESQPKVSQHSRGWKEWALEEKGPLSCGSQSQTPTAELKKSQQPLSLSKVNRFTSTHGRNDLYVVAREADTTCSIKPFCCTSNQLVLIDREVTSTSLTGAYLWADLSGLFTAVPDCDRS